VSAPDVFRDMLVGQEDLHHVLGGPGVSTRKTHTWWQVALTDFRILAVKMTAPHGAASWTVAQRWAINKNDAKITQFPRTTTGAARLEITGFPELLILNEIDSPDLHSHIAPFLRSWGGPVQGVQAVAAAKHSHQDEVADTSSRKMLAIAGLAAIAVGVCCGGSMILATLRDVIAGFFS